MLTAGFELTIFLISFVSKSVPQGYHLGTHEFGTDLKNREFKSDREGCLSREPVRGEVSAREIIVAIGEGQRAQDIYIYIYI